MPLLQQVKLLPYNTKELFDMVLDIESYPSFLPWCTTSMIISENEDYIIAELAIQVKAISEKYQSKIISKILEDKKKYLIDVEAISGPFKYLKNTWHFSQEGKYTKIEFFIDFKMKSTIIDKVTTMFFSSATIRIINAFEERAKSLSLSKIT